ncbi:MAG: outer membrane protein assembly factor BamB family protein [Planctomycetota bacterium]
MNPLAFLCGLVLTVGAVPAFPADERDEVFLNLSQDLADLLGILSHPNPGWTPETQCELLDRIQQKIGEVKTCFFRGFDGRPREVRQELKVRFRALPKEVQEAYRRRIDPLAKELWHQGVREQPAKLRAILVRYPLSSWAEPAARTLARTAVEGGDFSEALRWLMDAAPPGKELTPPDALLAAFCHQRSGWLEKARQLASALKENPEVGEQARSLLAGALASPPAQAKILDGKFLPAPHRTHPLDPPDIDRECRSASQRKDLLLHPFTIPFSAGNLLLLGTRRSLRAFETVSGSMLWAFPDDPSGLPVGRFRGNLIRPVLQDQHCAVSFGAYLVVFDTRTGKVLWHFGDPSVIPALPQKNAVPAPPPPAVISPPVPFEGDWLAVMTAVRGATESFLLRFAPDGTLRWHLFLASGPAPRGLGYVPMPRLTLRGGVAYISTGIGAVVAVSIEGPRFLWGHLYAALTPGVQGILDQLTLLSQGPDPMVHPPLLYVMAEDAGRLLAMDVLTGEPAWDFRAPPRAILAGVQGNLAVVQGDRTLLGLDRWGGKVLWETALPGMRTLGLPACTPGRVHVPTDKGILTAGIGSGRILARLPFEKNRDPGWNLVSTADGLLAGGFCEVLELRDASRESLDPRGRLLALLSEDRWKEAVALLHEPGRSPPALPSDTLLLAVETAAERGELPAAQAMMKALRERAPADLASLGRALLALARVEAKAGKTARAFERVREILAIPKAILEEREVGPVPVKTSALALCRSLLAGPEGAELWEGETRKRLALALKSSDRASLDAFRSCNPFSMAWSASLRVQPKDGVGQAQLRALWDHGVREGPGARRSLEVLAGFLRPLDRNASDQVHLLLGRPGPGALPFRAPKLAGGSLTPLWHQMARDGGGVPIEVQFSEESISSNAVTRGSVGSNGGRTWGPGRKRGSR